MLSKSSASTLVSLSLSAGVVAYLAHSTRKNKQKETAEDDDSIRDSKIAVTLPPWASTDRSPFNRTYHTDEEKMSLAIELSRRNVVEKTGGPFGCAIFERFPTHSKLVSVGMNRVVPLNNSVLHGETVAIQMAQASAGNFTLRSNGRSFELFTSCEPCAMCLGACFWSGVDRIVCGATKADASAIGFDEGPVFETSYQYLRDAGIELKFKVMRKEAAEVLRQYGDSEIIYNA